MRRSFYGVGLVALMVGLVESGEAGWVSDVVSLSLGERSEREAAVLRLKDLEPPILQRQLGEHVGGLIRSLGDESEIVRRFAAVTLWQIASLSWGGRSEGTEMEEAYAANGKALWEGSTALVQHLDSPDPIVREYVAMAFGFMKPHPPVGAAEALIGRLRDRGENERASAAALYALSRIRPVCLETVVAIERSVDVEAREVAEAAIRALGRVFSPDPGFLRALAEILEWGPPKDRAWAARELQHVQPGLEAALAARILTAALEEEESEFVVSAVRNALVIVQSKIALGGEGFTEMSSIAVGALVSVLEMGDVKLRRAALSALGDMGSTAAPAKEALRAIERDPDEDAELRGLATTALDKIGKARGRGVGGSGGIDG